MTIVRYLDPKNDLAFKKIFGTEKNKDILLHFLNDILRNNNKIKIKEIQFLSGSQDPEVKFLKQSIVDVLCTDEKGVMFIVEMQVAKVGGFEKRAQYYAARAYSSQAKVGEEYELLKEIVFLAITDYVMFPNKRHYKSDHVILDKVSYEHDLKDFSFTFIELPKFKKDKVDELKSYEEKWCYFFKHSNNSEDMEKIIQESDAVIKRAYDELKTFNWSEEELVAYERINKANMDARAVERFRIREATEKAMKKGMKEGMEKGIKEGMEKGIKEGREKGIKEGREKGIKEGKEKGIKEGKEKGIKEGKEKGIKEGKEKGIKEGKEKGIKEGIEKGMEKGMKEVARKMLAKGNDIEEVIEITGLKLEEVKALIQK